MNLFRRLKLKHRILLLPLIPILGLLLASGIVLRDRSGTAADMKELVALTGVTTTISELVHELQKERGASAVFLGSKGTQLVRELPEQRVLTDQKRAAFERVIGAAAIAHAGGRLAEIVAQATAPVRELDDKRRQISAQQIEAPASNVYFTTTIARLLDIGLEISKVSRNSEIAAALSGYVSFMQAKERAGHERANGAPGFAAGRFDLAQYRRLVGSLSDQDTYFQQFARYATPDQTAFLARTVVGEPVSEVERMRKLAVETPPGQDLIGTDGPHWFRMTTARINLLKQVEDRLAQDLLTLAARIGADAQTLLWTAVAAGVVLLVLTAILGVIIIRGVTGPIAAMTGAMKRLAGGDTSVAVPALGRGDEVGEMAGAVQVFKDNMIETERLRAEQAEAEKRAVEEKKAAMHALADNFEASVRGVVQAVSSASTEMQSSAQAMSATAEEASRQSTTVAAASEEASTNVQTVASAAEELSSSVAEISRQVAQSTKITTKAVEEAQSTDAKVQGLADAAQKIGDVVQLINDIAAQTNLLALNATIEAARAGEAGKGFAVVASEVKSLANQTAKATEEIGAQIAAIQTATKDSVEAIKGIGATIAEVNQIATSIASAVEQQGAATQEIARNVQQAAAGTTEVSTNITGVTQAASETGSAATQVLGAAGELSRQSEMLRNEVDRFLARVRAA